MTTKDAETLFQCFRFDAWIKAKAEDLIEGDKIIIDGKRLIVTSTPSVLNGKLTVSVTEELPSVIQVDLSYGILAQAMDYAGTGLHVFEDGTAILADLEWSPGFVYSPRLPKKDLEEFCKNNLSKYKEFFHANQQSIDMGVSVKMTPWWI